MENNKIFKIVLITLILVVFISIGIVFVMKDSKKEAKQENTIDLFETSYFRELPQDIPLEMAIKEDYFVITEDKVYNKNILDRFINNTEFNAKNRVEDKIRIIVYNHDGYPTIYDLEYKTGNNAGYILKKDATRNNIIPEEIKINSNIPAGIYGITITEESGFDVAIISLSLYAEIQYDKKSENEFKNIEIARYKLSGEFINKI